MKKTVIGLTIAGAMLAAAGPSAAHHSTNLWYDMQKTVTLTGTFQQLRWINPHAVVQVYIKDAAGQPQLWQMETHGSQALARLGWRPAMFKAGDILTITGNPSRKGLNTLSLLEIKTTDGRDFKVNPAT